MGCCGDKMMNARANAQSPLEKSLPVLWCVTLLRGYKRFISPLLPPSCRFTPTCSEYAIEAVQSRGLIRGSFLAVLRLLRCHPFARGGYDPVDKKHCH